jgi:hypothetical protein
MRVRIPTSIGQNSEHGQAVDQAMVRNEIPRKFAGNIFIPNAKSSIKAAATSPAGTIGSA